jgi:hypothetical protein
MVILRVKSPNRSCQIWGPNQKTITTSFEAKPRETVATGFEAKPEKTVATGFEAKLEKTVAAGFEAKPEKTVRVVLKPNHKQTILVDLRPNHWQTNRWPWFWGSTKKPALLITTCMVQTTHSITRALDRLATDYPTCATNTSPLHQVSYSYHDPHQCLPCRTYHLHTTRQTNAILQMKQR